MALTNPVELVIESAGIIAVCAIIGEGLRTLIKAVAVRAGAHPATLRSIREGMRIIWVTVAALGVIYSSGITSELTILTVSGIAGLVVSLSLQSLFSNVISGIFLLRDGALRVGDVISYGGVKGRVARVALRNTWIITDAGEVAVIGNTALSSGPLVNLTASRRLTTQFEL